MWNNSPISALMSPFCVYMVANLPPFSANVLGEGYPSFSVIVLDTNAQGYRTGSCTKDFVWTYHRCDR
ncbi:unnamed protein product [Onchocerca flexuosa]|uniref:Secreted protein n=1 Tax=Onchocerca flexuosa TaxID=387005 RepID=A0A183HRQ8_9BILA|nr:unnamed protein product [Onchocerca flexuosa]